MSLEQQYADMLARTDHPVFKKDFSTVVNLDSPFNTILNRLLAKQLVRLREDLEILKPNSFPHSLTADGIEPWEETYFGYAKGGGELSERVDQLLTKINSHRGLAVADVLDIAMAVTGQTPKVIRNLHTDGWHLGEAYLGIDSVLSGGPELIYMQTYVVVFYETVSSDLLEKFDQELTKAEKAGSTHAIEAPIEFWFLGSNFLGIDTVLG